MSSLYEIISNTTKSVPKAHYYYLKGQLKWRKKFLNETLLIVIMYVFHKNFYHTMSSLTKLIMNEACSSWPEDASQNAIMGPVW